MEISLEISMYPLQQEYKTSILKFIDKLNTFENLEVITNPMSTQIFGEFDTIMEAYTSSMKEVFKEEKSVVMATKFINKNLL